MVNTINIKESKKFLFDNFHDSWILNEDISDLAESEYLENMLMYINETYNKHKLTYPRKREDIFKVFKETALDDVKVVIFNDEPSTNMLSSGIGKGCYNLDSSGTDAYHPTVIKDIEKSLKLIYDVPEQIKFDKSLVNWCKQGVLILNTSFISSYKCANSKDIELICRNFIRTIVKVINEERTGVVFVFTDDDQHKHFSKYINEDYHTTMITENIWENSTSKGFSVYEEINNELLIQEEEPIYWI